MALGGGDVSGMHVGRAQLKAVGVRARAERTANMRYMVVTLDVSQLEMSALKYCKPLKRSRMSVMAETSQSAIKPYVAMARVGLALYFWTAVFREALVKKVYAAAGLGLVGGGDGDGVGGGGEGLGEGGGGEGEGGGGEGGSEGGDGEVGQLPGAQLEP